MPIFPLEVLNYRNAIYHGSFDHRSSVRHGFGIHFNTSSKEFIVSSFLNDHLNNHTVIFNHHYHYMYGNWIKGYPHGYFVMRLSRNVIFGEYDMGILKDKFVIVIEEDNLAVTVQKNINDEFQVTRRSQLYDIGNLSDYLSLVCGMERFPSQYETLIKYISEYIISTQCKLKLIQDKYFRFGYQIGLCIMFDESYRIYTVGQLHNNKIKQIGVIYGKDYIQQGHWGRPNQVVAYHLTNPPNKKINKIYKTNSLRGLNFINLFTPNYSNLYMDEMNAWLESSNAKMIQAGLISSRKRKGIEALNTLTISGNHKVIDRSTKVDDQIIIHNVTKVGKQKIDQVSKSTNKQSKMPINHLQRIKQQIYQQIMKKKKETAIKQIKQEDKQDMKINEFVSSKLYQKDKKNNGYENFIIRQRSEEDINQSKQLSPFGSRMRSRIFNKPNRTIISPIKSSSKPHQHKPIFQNYKNNNNNSTIKSYQTPHQALNLSSISQYNLESSLEGYPLTIQNNNHILIQSKQPVKGIKKSQIYPASKNHFDKYNNWQFMPNKSAYLNKDAVILPNRSKINEINNNKDRLTYEPISEVKKNRKIQYEEDQLNGKWQSSPESNNKSKSKGKNGRGSYKYYLKKY